MSSEVREPRVGVLLATAVVAIAGGGLLGGLTNAINGIVSLTYFRNIMRWESPDDIAIWRASIAQGIFEGLLYGVLFAVVFTLVVGVVTRCRCYFSEVWPTLAVTFFAVLGCWVIGGILGVGLATLSPEFYQRRFIRVPEEFAAMLRYAWVGGSIWGVMFGGLLAVVISSIVFANRWRAARGHLLRQE